MMMAGVTVDDLEDIKMSNVDNPQELPKSNTSQSDDMDGGLVETIPNVTGGPPGYKCRKCDVFFPKWQMVLHIRSHTGEKPYVCDYEACNKAFSRPGILREHKKRTHEKLLQHTCPVCEKKFYGRSVMLQHIVIHDEARQQRERFLPEQMLKLLNQVEEFNFDGQMIISNCVCEECGRIFDNGSGKNRHMKGVHSRKHKCTDSSCGKSFLTESGLIRHMKECHQPNINLKYETIKVEIDPATIKCELNDTEAETEEDMKNEGGIIDQQTVNNSKSKEKILNHENQNLPYSCDLCENSLSSKESLDIHKLIHEELSRFRCKEIDCNDAFTNQKSLTKHLVSAHQLEMRDANKTFHVCEECGKQCTTKAGLQDHMQKHTTEKKYICMVCGKKLKRSYSLTMHMKIHAGEKNYQCDKCEASYINSAGLRNHTLAKHTEVTNAVKFICSYCGKDFKKKDYLLKHITGHTGEKKYKCSVCEKCFRFETSLASHMDMHNGIRKFQCPHCEKRFTQRQHMTVHVRRHTGDKRHKCDICSEAFIEPRCLRNHIKRHHD